MTETNLVKSGRLRWTEYATRRAGGGQECLGDRDFWKASTWNFEKRWKDNMKISLRERYVMSTGDEWV
jgi:hypothetical protein